MTLVYESLTWTVVTASVIIVVVGMVKLIYVPLAIWYEGRIRLTRTRRNWLKSGPTPGTRGFDASGQAPLASQLRYRRGISVSVIVPAYNEAVVLGPCVESIVLTEYPDLQVIIVNDGSTDDTADVMRGLAARYPCVEAIDQDNAGKGAALNTGIAHARGEVLLFVDADGLFARDTIEWLLVEFDDESIAAVCGDDRPANPDRVLTKFLSVISHVGTGLVRRALSLLHCLPIVSGNIGAFRAEVIRDIGGLREDTIGEDLELTWRIYEAGYRVAFQPRAIVYAESPSTLRGLWRQRVRWARGLLQTTRRHARMLGNPAYGVFGAYLALNTLSMVLVPLLQVLVLTCLVILIPTSAVSPAPDALALIGWLGLGYALGAVLLAILLNGAGRELRYLWTLPLWPVYSVFVGLTMVAAVTHELRGTPGRWNKLQRTGVVSASVRSSLRQREVV